MSKPVFHPVKTIPSHGGFVGFVGFVAMNLYGSLWVGLKYTPSQTTTLRGSKKKTNGRPPFFENITLMEDL